MELNHNIEKNISLNTDLAFQNFITKEGSTQAYLLQKRLQHYKNKLNQEILSFETKDTKTRLFQVYFRVSANEQFIQRPGLTYLLHLISLKFQSEPVAFVPELPTEIKLRERKEKGFASLFKPYHLTLLADLKNDEKNILQFLADLETLYFPEKPEKEEVSGVEMDEDDLLFEDEDLDAKIYPMAVSSYQNIYSEKDTYLVTWQVPINHFLGFKECFAPIISKYNLEFLNQHIDVKITVEFTTDNIHYLSTIPLFRYKNFLDAPLLIKNFNIEDISL